MREGWEVAETGPGGAGVAVLAPTPALSLPRGGRATSTPQPQHSSLERRLSALRRRRLVKRLWAASSALGWGLGFLTLAGLAGLGLAGVR